VTAALLLSCAKACADVQEPFSETWRNISAACQSTTVLCTVRPRHLLVSMSQRSILNVDIACRQQQSSDHFLRFTVTTSLGRQVVLIISVQVTTCLARHCAAALLCRLSPLLVLSSDACIVLTAPLAVSYNAQLSCGSVMQQVPTPQKGACQGALTREAQGAPPPGVPPQGLLPLCLSCTLHPTAPPGA